jgi:hypothetical protein
MHISLAILPTGRLRDPILVSPGPGGPSPSRKLMLKDGMLDVGGHVLLAPPSCRTREVLAAERLASHNWG